MNAPRGAANVTLRAPMPDSPGIQGKSVLLIDDDALLLRMMAIAFRGAGYRVHTAFDGADGLSIFHIHEIDLVVTDLVMPGKEGIETIIELNRRNASLKIIAISGGTYGRAAGYLTLARHLGADKVMLKPFSTADLLAVARSLLSDTGQYPAVAA